MDVISTGNPRSLIIQPGALGDTLLTLTIADFINRTLNLPVDLMGHPDYAGILPGRSAISKVISLEGARLYPLFNAQPAALPAGNPLFSQYALTITFLYDSSGQFVANLQNLHPASSRIISLALRPPTGWNRHVTDYYLSELAEQLGGKSPALPTISQTTRITPTTPDRLTGQTRLRQCGCSPDQPAVIIHPGSGGREKCAPLDLFLRLADSLRQRSVQPLFLLGPAELERWPAGDINQISSSFALLTSPPLEEALALLAVANGFAGNDSGITHLAGMLDQKTVAFFGPTNPDIWKPLGDHVFIHASSQSSVDDLAEVVSWLTNSPL